MKKSYRFAAAMIASLLLTATLVQQSKAIDDLRVMPESKVSIVASSQRNRLNVHLQNAYVLDVLKEIAQKGNINIIVRDQVGPKFKVWNAHMDNVSAEEAVEKVCVAANIPWQIQDKVYVVGFVAPTEPTKSTTTPVSAAVSQPEPEIDLEYAEIQTANLLAIIGELTNFRVVLSGTVFGESVRYIRLYDVTPSDAIQKISRASGFVCERLDNNTYRITKQENAQQ